MRHFVLGVALIAAAGWSAAREDARFLNFCWNCRSLDPTFVLEIR
jgi:hypothetical protein